MTGSERVMGVHYDGNPDTDEEHDRGQEVMDIEGDD